MDELIAEFISETSENLLNLDNELLELENNPGNIDLLSKIFRVMHTIKGTCGFLSLDKLASVAHAAENILDQIRNKKILVSAQNISIILESVDVIKSIIDYIQNHGEEPKIDYSSLINKINLSLEQNIQDPAKEAPFPPIQEVYPTHTIEEHGENIANQTVKVKVEVLDQLMQAVSELVLNRNQLLQLDRVIRNNKLSSGLQVLSGITSSIQEVIMQTRMQPIGNAWAKIPRMIRDLSKDLNKKIKLVMIGQETELDKQLIEAIKDPLVHMIRNSADHGLEKEADRIAAGKSPEGTITLKAYHASGHVIIEMSDDGYGINIAKVKSKILEKSLATEKEIAALSEQQIIQYIFKAGFSTAESITSVSGRGVGMDVVKNNIDNIHGSIELKSITGQGTTFVIKIPLTLAIMPILIVESQKQKFGVPQSSVLEMVLINSESRHYVEEINNHKILRLRESLVSLISLSEILQLPASSKDEDYYIIICDIDGIVFGLIVDNIYDIEEIVLKPISMAIKSIAIYSGITLLGNGDIIIILDPDTIAKYVSHGHAYKVNPVKKEIQQTSILSSFLIVKAGEVYKAIPLELISRLEEINVAKLENIRGRKVIQYNNSLMYIEKLDPDYKMAQKGKQLVVVLNNNVHTLGLAVEKIIEIVNQDIEDRLNSSVDNTSTVVLSDKMLDIIDVDSYFNKLFFTPNELIDSTNAKCNILLVESSPYFRKLLSSLLKAEGFNVVSAKSRSEALDIINKQKIDFNLFIIDFNMSNIDGIELAKLCKETPIIGLTSNVELSESDIKTTNVIIKNFVSKSNHSELIEIIYSLIKGT